MPPPPAGEVVVDCRFSYDASGLLEVDVTVPETGVTKQLVICDDDAADDRREVADAGARCSPR